MEKTFLDWYKLPKEISSTSQPVLCHLAEKYFANLPKSIVKVVI